MNYRPTTSRERGGNNRIAAMLGRGESFEDIDAARAMIEQHDREADRRKWQPGKGA